MGSVRNSINVQKAVQEQVLNAYEQTVLRAVQETRDTLAAFEKEQQRFTALTAAVDAAHTASELAQDRYTNGLASFDSVLEGQRSLLVFQDQLIQSRGEITLNFIQLYKALGGGWQPME
jgi:outer membrane protein TolC